MLAKTDLDMMLADPENMQYMPYAMAGLLFGWTIDEVDKLGVEQFGRILAVGIAIWKETNILNVVGKALRGVGMGRI